ncbi:hypothetical protein PG993_011423 [Apiospora rasikravindrae]|uniref:Uncharacterized protein n=1 Tax=Apiospora rasikravindrae TaxID=990691 RepID=A0ABR1SGJ0_9PEZI
MASHSKHAPEDPAWTANDLEARLTNLTAWTEGSSTEAVLQGRAHLYFLTNYLYPRYIALLDDIRRAIAAAEQNDPELLPTLVHLETQILDGFNDYLRQRFYDATSDGPGVPFFLVTDEPDERIGWLRNLMNDFRSLQADAGLQRAYSARLQAHFKWMQDIIDDCLPPSYTLWVNGDLVGHPDFDTLWAEFQDLQTAKRIDADSGVVTVPNTDTENRRLVENSQNIVREAFDALLISHKEIDITWSDLQDPTGVPAYLEYPPYKARFWEGGGDHDGAQLLMENLGWSEDMALQSFRNEDPSMLSAVMEAQAKKNQFEAIKNGNKRTGTNIVGTSAPVPKKAKISLNGEMENENGEEPVEEGITEESEPEPEEEEVEEVEEELDEDDMYTIDDALNDVAYLRNEAGVGPAVEEGTNLVTQTVPIKEDALKRYGDELKRFVRRHEDKWDYIQTQHDHLVERGAEPSETPQQQGSDDAAAAPSATQDGPMRSHLAALAKALLREEDTLKTAQAMTPGSARLKAYALSTWRSRYLRCLQLCLLALASGVSAEQFDNAYERRLEDWIEHETAWNEQDRYAIEKLLKTEASKEEARERIARREENIKDWNDILEGNLLVEGEDEVEDAPEVFAKAAQAGGKGKGKSKAPGTDDGDYVSGSNGSDTDDEEYIPGNMPPVTNISLGPEFQRDFNALHEKLIRKKAPQDAAMAQRAPPGPPGNYAQALPEGWEHMEEMADWTEEEKQQREKEDMEGWIEQDPEQLWKVLQQQQQQQLQNQNPIDPFALPDFPDFPPTSVDVPASIPPYRVQMPDGPVLGSLTWDTTGPAANQRAKDPESRAKFAQLGPRGYEGIPTNTVYEKLQYMIILTLWRCQTAADTGL